jgi:hypothetical protein
MRAPSLKYPMRSAAFSGRANIGTDSTSAANWGPSAGGTGMFSTWPELGVATTASVRAGSSAGFRAGSGFAKARRSRGRLSRESGREQPQVSNKTEQNVANGVSVGRARCRYAAYSVAAASSPLPDRRAKAGDVRCIRRNMPKRAGAAQKTSAPRTRGPHWQARAAGRQGDINQIPELTICRRFGIERGGDHTPGALARATVACTTSA